MIKGDSYTSAAEIWNFGVLTHFMTVGHYPFFGSDIQKTCHKILFTQPTFPNDLSIVLKDLIIQMLTKTPNQRITLQGIFEHPWFSARDFLSLSGFISNMSSIFTFSSNVYQKMNTIGIDTSSLKPKLFAKEFDDITSNYRIIYRQDMMRELTESIASRQRSDTLGNAKDAFIEPSKSKPQLVSNPSGVFPNHPQIPRVQKRHNRERSSSTKEPPFPSI